MTQLTDRWPDHGPHAYILVGNFGKVMDGFARKGRVMVRVSVVGAKGRMGSHVVDAVNGAQDMQLAFALDAGDDLMRITPENTDVVVEFTVPSVSLDNVLALVKRGSTWWSAPPVGPMRDSPSHGALARLPVTIRPCSSRPTSRFPPCWPIISPRSPRRTSSPRRSSSCIIPPRWMRPPEPLSTLPAPSRMRARRPPRRHAGRTETDGGSRGQVVDGVHVHAVRLRGLERA